MQEKINLNICKGQMFLIALISLSPCLSERPAVPAVEKADLRESIQAAEEDRERKSLSPERKQKNGW